MYSCCHNSGKESNIHFLICSSLTGGSVPGNLVP
jgi:hypothetical protein